MNGDVRRNAMNDDCRLCELRETLEPITISVAVREAGTVNVTVFATASNFQSDTGT